MTSIQEFNHGVVTPDLNAAIFDIGKKYYMYDFSIDKKQQLKMLTNKNFKSSSDSKFMYFQTDKNKITVINLYIKRYHHQYIIDDDDTIRNFEITKDD